MFDTFFSGLDILTRQLAQVWIWLNTPVGNYAGTIGTLTGNPFLIIAGWIMNFTPISMLFSSFLILLSVITVFRLLRLINPIA